MTEAKRKKFDNDGDIQSLHVNVISGYRIVDLLVLARNLKCWKCQTILSLEDIVSEKLLGLHSIFNVKFHQCSVLTSVPTGSTNGRFAFSIVLGSIHSGAGCVALNKILACADIPGLSAYTQEI
ncbi:hypothetical protein QAD02_021711 [Eretmocerus hayati]|uniref:Uncharacterized protein n=1 Tax=Eretmocerus hayati TaxID=131215 RepID=A0ACC2PSE7_9HYME|nr:hypothetical protein QAD02_021711 [Eretmocerus hayati]